VIDQDYSIQGPVLRRTPLRLNVVHVNCYGTFSYVIHLKSAPNFGEAQEVEGLRVGEIGVGEDDGDGGPVGTEPPAKAVGVVARAEVVVAGLRIAFFAFESALHSMAKKNRCMQPFTQNVQTFTFL
jgi:hypothetical protein